MVLISPLWQSIRNGWARSQVGQGVGREALVEDGERRGEALVGQVEVEVAEGVGGHQALVHDRAERARRHVGALGGGVDAAPQAVGPALEVLAADVAEAGLGAAGHELLDAR